MRTVLFSLCMAAVLPLSAFAAANGNHDPVDIILKDHQQITKMIGQLETDLSDPTKAREDFKQLKTFLENHEKMEEKTWYPELEKHDQLKPIVKRLKDQEETADDEIDDIDDISNDQEWTTKVKKLIADVKAHANDEETNLLPKVKSIVDKEKLKEIGNEMVEFKKDQND